MAVFANIVLNDGAATPVAHTFAVKSNDNSVTTFEDRVGGVPIGYGKLIFRTSETSEQRTVKVDIVVPVLEAVSGANAAGFTPPAKVAYQNIGKLEFRTSLRSTLQQRKDLVAYVKHAAALTLLSSIVADSENISG